MSKSQSIAQKKRFSKSINYRKDDWISQSKIVHNNRYDYSKVEYSNQITKVEIICPDHGSFFQRPCDHKNQKQGCPKCSHNFPLTKEDFIRKSRSLYKEKYTLLGDFKGTKHPVILWCSEHGEFKLNCAEVHFRNNGGCPSCWYELRLENLKPGNISKKETEWLDSLNVPLRQEKIIIENKTYLVDGFDPESNTVYEYYGSFWHGNPEKYNLNDLNTVLNKTFGELYQKTLDREKVLKQYYKLKTLWE
jgi:hypothetical protein